MTARPRSGNAARTAAGIPAAGTNHPAAPPPAFLEWRPQLLLPTLQADQGLVGRAERVFAIQPINPFTGQPIPWPGLDGAPPGKPATEQAAAVPAPLLHLLFPDSLKTLLLYVLLLYLVTVLILTTFYLSSQQSADDADFLPRDGFSDEIFDCFVHPNICMAAVCCRGFCAPEHLYGGGLL